MAGYNFRRRQDAQQLLELLNNSGSVPRRMEAVSTGQGDAVTSIIIDIPSGGIAARSGTTPGSASCTPFYINDAGTLEQVPDSVDITVYNLATDAVTGSRYGQAKNVLGKWVIDVEYCDGTALLESSPYEDVYT